MMISYYKGEPNTYTICSRNGRAIRHGVGINFWYSFVTTSIAAVPLASQESQFIFNETTADFQEVSVQGSLTYRLDKPLEVAKRLDFTVHPKTLRYKTEDPGQLVQRVVNSVQAHTRSQVSQLSLEEALTEVKDLSALIFEAVVSSPELRRLGIVLEGLHFTAVKTTPEMQKALESRRKSLVDTQARNSLKLAEAEAKAEEMKLSPFGELPPQALVGLALKEWAANAGTIDNLSITPDLLSKVVSYVSEARD